METLDPRIYPIGKHTKAAFITSEMRLDNLARMESLPGRLQKIASALNAKQLQSSYRKNGWTTRQIIHHIADSHCNMYIRIKLALTADNPTINAYDENKWAEFPDAKDGDIGISLTMIESLHNRILTTLSSLQSVDFSRTYTHPQYQAMYSIDEVLAQYAWHGDHHLAQINVILNDV